MPSSRSFDRAAAFYDQTRPFPEPAASLGISAIREIAGPGARILEVGAGTGRVSIPLLQGGADLFGIDLSEKMLGRLIEKYPTAKLARGDAAHLPFPDGRFDALLTVHVMHLVSEWRQALSEFRRVLESGGVYINARTYEPVGGSPRRQAREYWSDWLAGRGYRTLQPGIQSNEDLVDELTRIGAQVEEVEVTRYIHRYVLREELERLSSRIYSDTWDLPEEIFTEGLAVLQSWIVENFGDLDREVEDLVSFKLDVARFG